MSYRHPVVERGNVEPDAMIAHNREVHHQVLHAGHRFYAGRRRGVERWTDVFNQVVDGPGDQSVEAFAARQAAERARIAPYWESPRPPVPSWW